MGKQREVLRFFEKAAASAAPAPEAAPAASGAGNALTASGIGAAPAASGGAAAAAPFDACSPPDFNTALHLAVTYRRNSLCRALVQRALKSPPGINLNARNARGQTPVHLALLHRNEGALKFLLSRSEADPAAEDAEGNSLLHYAAMCESISRKLLQLLLQKAAPAFAPAEAAIFALRNKNGLSPFQLAVGHGSADFCRFALARLPDGLARLAKSGAESTAAEKAAGRDRRTKYLAENRAGEAGRDGADGGAGAGADGGGAHFAAAGGVAAGGGAAAPGIAPAAPAEDILALALRGANWEIFALLLSHLPPAAAAAFVARGGLLPRLVRGRAPLALILALCRLADGKREKAAAAAARVPFWGGKMRPEAAEALAAAVDEDFRRTAPEPLLHLAVTHGSDALLAALIEDPRADVTLRNCRLQTALHLTCCDGAGGTDTPKTARANGGGGAGGGGAGAGETGGGGAGGNFAAAGSGSTAGFADGGVGSTAGFAGGGAAFSAGGDAAFPVYRSNMFHTFLAWAAARREVAGVACEAGALRGVRDSKQARSFCRSMKKAQKAGKRAATPGPAAEAPALPPDVSALLDSQDACGTTLLHAVLESPRVPTGEKGRLAGWLLALGAAPAPRDAAGRTPLHCAVDGGLVDACAQLLRAAPAAAEARDAAGRTPKEIALERQQTDLIDLFGEDGGGGAVAGAAG